MSSGWSSSELWLESDNMQDFLDFSPERNMGVEPKIGVPQNGWFMMETPIKMDDLG